MLAALRRGYLYNQQLEKEYVNYKYEGTTAKIIF